MFHTNSLFIPGFLPPPPNNTPHTHPTVLSNFSMALGRSASGKAATLRGIPNIQELKSTHDVSDTWVLDQVC